MLQYNNRCVDPKEQKVLYRLVGVLVGLSMISEAGSLSLKPSSDVVSVTSPWSIGVGAMYMRLSNLDSKERIRDTLPMVQIGYRWSRYAAVRLYLSASVRDVRYRRGSAAASALSSRFRYQGLYLRASYPLGNLSPYLLAGIGRSTLTNLAGRDRVSVSPGWGAGVSYRITDHFSADLSYLHQYEAKGFDGRASADRIRIDSVQFGLRYRF